MGLLDKLFKEMGALTGSHQPVTKPEKRYCPVDGTEMELIRIRFAKGKEVVELDRCPKCGGIWFDRGELNKIIRIPTEKIKEIFGDVKEKVSIKGTSSGPRLCPVCGSPMITYNYDYKSGIWLDACPKGHGIWLDAGELLLLKLYIERGETFRAKEDMPTIRKVERADRKEREKQLEREFMEAMKALEGTEETAPTSSPAPKREEIPFEPSATTERVSLSKKELTPKPSLAEKHAVPERRQSSGPQEMPAPKLASELAPSVTSSTTASSLTTSAVSSGVPELKVQAKELGGFWTIRDILQLPDGKIVLLGDGGRVMISADGESFQQVAELKENLTKGTVFGDKLVVVSSYGSLFYAPLSDLSSFQKVSLGYKALNWVMTIGDMLLILGSSATLKISKDLSEFADLKVDTFADLNSASYAEGKLIIVGASGTVLMGSTVDSLQKVDLGTTSTFRTVRYVAGAFHLVGSSATLAVVYPDGRHELSGLRLFGDFNDVTEFRGKLLIAGSSGKLYYGTLAELREIKTGGFSSYYRCLNLGDKVLVVGDKATILTVS